MEDNIIEIGGKQINLSKLNDAQLLKLRQNIEAREAKCKALIAQYEAKYPFLKDIDVEDYINL